MRLSARVRANRRNARRSTGPRTSEGKSRVAKNAVRHGLAISVTADPALADASERLARVIAGHHVDPARLEGARRVAEAQIDLLRVRRVRVALLNDPRARVKEPSVRQVIHTLKQLELRVVPRGSQAGRDREDSRTRSEWRECAWRATDAGRRFGSPRGRIGAS